MDGDLEPRVSFLPSGSKRAKEVFSSPLLPAKT